MAIQSVIPNNRATIISQPFLINKGGVPNDSNSNLNFGPIALLLCLGLNCFAAFEEETVLLYLFDEETADEATDLSEFENRGEITW